MRGRGEAEVEELLERIADLGVCGAGDLKRIGEVLRGAPKPGTREIRAYAVTCGGELCPVADQVLFATRKEARDMARVYYKHSVVLLRGEVAVKGRKGGGAR